ncbi:methylated-DNA--[protein]-cysteine S-methyltransferase [Caviibacter abscessus]|uniref:methylated-DNA--[protein]-cysteine S-methyltransferase n=1 Tax=Caviibacter abscessus TaxID=1766719 RepID=UPI000838AC30|nr:methylated-DNA--[protein]-cysteine S-methyltransferase [Caviibacter abscessus]
MKNIYYYTYDTIMGEITIACEDDSIIYLEYGKNINFTGINKRVCLLDEAYNQLTQYFSGKRKNFELKLNPKGTDFQKKVWQALTKIPYGKTVSYYDIACSIGNEKACRAVGMANNKNPISIIIPCHRVIGKNGKMVGYASGIDRKVFLLELESKI